MGYCPLHYGGEFLNEAIKSVEPYVEKIIILYTSIPSYGHYTNNGCPESEEELRNIAYTASNKVEWHNVTASNEGTHRGLIYKFAEGFDGILAFDADEVMGDLTEVLPLCFASKKRYIGFSGYVNFWKSFNYACYDGFTPIRYTNLNNIDAVGCDVVPATVYHFSCAQRMEIMRYKLEIHGHKAEIRHDWLTDIYGAWSPENNFGNLHLVSYIPALWNAVEFDRTTLPDLLKIHPNYDKKTIE